MGQVWNMETSKTKPLMRRRKIKDVVKTGTCFYIQDKFWGNLFTARAMADIKVE